MGVLHVGVINLFVWFHTRRFRTNFTPLYLTARWMQSNLQLGHILTNLAAHSQYEALDPVSESHSLYSEWYESTHMLEASSCSQVNYLSYLTDSIFRHLNECPCSPLCTTTNTWASELDYGPWGKVARSDESLTSCGRSGRMWVTYLGNTWQVGGSSVMMWFCWESNNLIYGTSTNWDLL